MDNFDALLKGAGFDVPDVEVTNTGEAFEFFKHCIGNYSGIVGQFNIDYTGLDGKKCLPNAVGAKQRNFGQLDLIITNSPDKHGFKSSEFLIAEGQEYGEFIFKVYTTFDGDKQFQNKNLYDTFKIAGAPTTDVIKPGMTDKDFKLDTKAFGFYRGAPVTFELKQGTKNVYIVGLTLQDNLLTPEKFKERNASLDKIYGSLNALREKEAELRKVKKSQSAEDKALSGGTTGGFSSQPSAEDVMDSMMGMTDEFK